eukprot:307604-Amorphochlora_amoeboformis.AAC.1
MVLKREAVVLRNGDPNSHERVKERGNNHRRHQVGAHAPKRSSRNGVLQPKAGRPERNEGLMYVVLVAGIYAKYETEKQAYDILLKLGIRSLHNLAN